MSWCCCGLNIRICSHSAVQLQSCAQTNQPICDPKPEKETTIKAFQYYYLCIGVQSQKEDMSDSRVLYLKSGPIPRSVPVCRPLQMTKLNLIGSIGATYSDREFHLEELVRLCPDHLKFKDVMHLLDTEVVSCQRFSRFLQISLMF